MRIAVKPRAPRKPRERSAPRPQGTASDPTWIFSWQPPSEMQWQNFVREARASGSKILNQLSDRPAAPAGANDGRNRVNFETQSKGKSEMKVSVKREVPPSVYDANFDGVEETNHEQYGAGLVWSWVITKGKYRGEKVFRTTKPFGTKKNSCGDFMKSLTGLSLEQAASCDLDNYVGRACSVVVKESESGSSRVETFVVLNNDEPEPDEKEAGNDDGDEVPFDV